MIQDDHVCLRPWKEDDVPILADIRNDVELQQQLLSRARGSSRSQVMNWLKTKSAAKDGFFFVIAHADNDRAAGFLQLSKHDPTDKHIELGLCLHTAEQGKGMGSQAISLVVEFLRTSVDVRKIILAVRSDNARGIRCYQRLGFDKCGTYRQHFFCADKWHDVVMMEKFL